MENIIHNLPLELKEKIIHYVELHHQMELRYRQEHKLKMFRTRLSIPMAVAFGTMTTPWMRLAKNIRKYNKNNQALSTHDIANLKNAVKNLTYNQLIHYQRHGFKLNRDFKSM